MKGSLIGSSPWYKLFIVFVLVIVSTFVSLLVGTLSIPLFFDISFSGLMDYVQSPELYERVDIVLYLQGLTTIGTFVLPALVAVYLISPFSSDYLGLSSFPKKAGIIVGLLVVLTLSGTVISDSLYRLSLAIPFPESMLGLKEYLDSAQVAMEEQMGRFLDMNGPFDFITVLIIMAVLPAVCEETLFRGVIQPLFIRAFKSSWAGIVVSSIIFGILHQQFYSFLSIFALSVVLGYLKYWTKSLWVSMIMHFFNNASIVVAIYFFDVSMEDINGSTDAFSLNYFLVGSLLFGLSLYAMNRLSKEKRRDLV